MTQDLDQQDKMMPKAVLQIHKPIVLVGLMGAGKTTVGRRLANELKLPFFDADHEIEKAADMIVADYFEKYGEAAFRDGEEKVIERLLNGPICVLATGGGAILSELTRKNLKEKATTIWLKADLKVLVKRTSQRNTRPLLRGKNPKHVLEKLIKERHPLYAEADITIESKDTPHQTAVDLVIAALGVDQITHDQASKAKAKTSNK